MSRRISEATVHKYARVCKLDVLRDSHGISIGCCAVSKDKERVFIELHRVKSPAEAISYLVAYRDTMASTAMAAAYLFPDARDDAASQVERIQNLARRVCLSRALPV